MGKPKRSARPNAKGRNSGSRRFVQLEHALLESAAYSSLTGNARSLLVELMMLFNGRNNGSLYLSVRDAAARIGVADLGAVGRAFDDLCEAGFIECAKGSSFTSKAGRSLRKKAEGPQRAIGGTIRLLRVKPQSAPTNGCGRLPITRNGMLRAIFRFGIPERWRTNPPKWAILPFRIPEHSKGRRSQFRRFCMFGIPAHIYILPGVGAGRLVSIGPKHVEKPSWR